MLRKKILLLIVLWVGFVPKSFAFGPGKKSLCSFLTKEKNRIVAELENCIKKKRKNLCSKAKESIKLYVKQASKCDTHNKRLKHEYQELSRKLSQIPKQNGINSSPTNPCNNSKQNKTCIDYIFRGDSYRERGVTGTDYKANLDVKNVGKDLLQVLGQITVDRAKRAAISVIKSQLTSILCSKKNVQIFKNSCKVIKYTDFKNLISKPDTLLDAAIRDLFSFTEKKLRKYNKERQPPLWQELDKISRILEFEELAELLLQQWLRGGKEMIGVLKSHIKKLIIKFSRDKLTCKEKPETSKFAKVLFLKAGQCLIKKASKQKVNENRNSNGGRPSISLVIEQALAECLSSELQKARNLKKPAKKELNCIFRISQKQRKLFKAFFRILSTLFKYNDKKNLMKVTRESAKATVEVLITLLKSELANIADSHKKKKKALTNILDGIQEMVQGLIGRDWVQSGMGMTLVIKGILEYPKPNQTLYSSGNISKFISFVVSLGQYVETYSTGNKSTGTKNAQEARKKILENLIDKFTDRKELWGWVLSLGGSFGGGGGGVVRGLLSNKIELGSWAAPSLNLGFGLQYYPWKIPIGFHMQLGIFDLGQYVTFKSPDTFDVGSPQIEDALSINLVAGAWFGPRNAPIFIALRTGVAPFAGKERKAAIYFGAVMGVYIPFFDLVSF